VLKISIFDLELQILYFWEDFSDNEEFSERLCFGGEGANFFILLATMPLLPFEFTCLFLG